MKIIIAIVVGAGIGYLVSVLSRSTGASCPITCNPYVSTVFGGVMGLLMASGGNS